jgi:hypothetical protein
MSSAADEFRDATGRELRAVSTRNNRHGLPLAHGIESETIVQITVTAARTGQFAAVAASQSSRCKRQESLMPRLCPC